MTNLRQDRVPDQTLSQGSVPEGRATADGRARASTRGIVLAVRLWTKDSSERAAAVSWQSVSPAASLALDLITASGGAPEPAQGPILRAGFYNAQSALLMVRRLQWALQGFADGGDSRGIAAAMLIHSVEDAPYEPLATALENAAPGQVLLSSAIAESVNQLPNVALRGAGQGSLVEVQWRSFEPESGSAADEQSVLRLIRDLGREDPLASRPQASTYPSVQTAHTEAPPSSMPAGSFAAGRAHVEDNSTEADGKKKWLIIGGAAAAVVLAGILFVVFGNHAKTPPPASPETTTTQPVAPAAPPATAPISQSDTVTKTDSTRTESTRSTPQKTGRTSPSDKTTRSKSEGTVEGRSQAQPAGSCDLTEAEIPRSLDRAEGYLHAGRLSDAQAVYQRLLGCPSARQRAAEGLQVVKQRIAAGTP
jgi:hypothetical protein